MWVRINPICGNCDKPLSVHHKGTLNGVIRTYCSTATTDEQFASTPRDHLILERLLIQMPETYDILVSEWRRENGHAV